MTRIALRCYVIEKRDPALTKFGLQNTAFSL